MVVEDVGNWVIVEDVGNWVVVENVSMVVKKEDGPSVGVCAPIHLVQEANAATKSARIRKGIINGVSRLNCYSLRSTRQ